MGAVVENLSNRKLFCLLGILVVVQTFFFLIGGLIAPAPSSYMDFLMLRCKDQSHYANRNVWFWTRPVNSKNCIEIVDPPHSMKHKEDADLKAEDIVFVAQMPLPRDGIDLEYSPWQQNLIGVMIPEIAYDTSGNWELQKNAELKLDVRLGYRLSMKDSWKELVRTTISRPLDCFIEEERKQNGFQYNCVPIELFELGSNDYPFYLLNIRIPVYENDTANKHIGKWEDIKIVAIHQNGGFTKVWMSLKTVVTPILFMAVVWYWRRITLLSRSPILLEKALMALGVTVTFLNFPIELLSLYIRMPFMLLLSDIRQGIFYAMLASFWLIFTGEHLMDDTGKNRLSNYSKHLSAVLFGCICLFIFDMCERGVHLTNPFYSIWSTTLGTNLAYGFIILAAICACLYFFFLCYLIVRVICTIKRRRASLMQMQQNRRLKFEGIIYRFKFLMLMTMICAALTVIGFIMGQVGEGQLHWGDFDASPTLQYTSAFFTGVYGMWNIYVFLLLSLYAPSHKQYGPNESVPLEDEDEFDVGELHPMTESSGLTSLTKSATD